MERNELAKALNDRAGKVEVTAQRIESLEAAWDQSPETHKAAPRLGSVRNLDLSAGAQKMLKRNTGEFPLN